MKLENIKFRIWNNKNKAYTPNILLHRIENGVRYGNDYHGVLTDYIQNGTGKELLQLAKIHNLDLALEPYTGIKDKNNKKIYHGDIVEIFDDNLKTNFTAVVLFLEKYNEIRFVRLTAPCCGLSYKKHLADKRIYIVDNIHSESNEKMTASMLCRENFTYNLKNNEKLKKAIEAYDIPVPEKNLRQRRIKWN